MRGRRMGLVSGVVLACSLAPAVSAATRLDRFLVRPGEESGFAPQGAPQVFRTARVWVAGEPRRRRKTDSARLRREGFVRAVSRLMAYTRAPNNGGALSWVVELGSSRAAKAEQRVQLRQTIAAQGRVKIARYTVPGVPGAKGFTATVSGQPGGASNTLFTEGRCLLLVGDAIPGGDIAAPVKAAVRAISHRTGGRCP